MWRLLFLLHWLVRIWLLIKLILYTLSLGRWLLILFFRPLLTSDIFECVKLDIALYKVRLFVGLVGVLLSFWLAEVHSGANLPIVRVETHLF